MDIDNQIRVNAKTSFKKLLNETMIKDIEESIYQFSIDYATVNETPYLLEQIYETKFDEILKLIKDKDNDYFLKKVKSGTFCPHQHVFLEYLEN